MCTTRMCIPITGKRFKIAAVILILLSLLLLLAFPVGSSEEPEGYDWEYYSHDVSGLLED